MINDKLTLFSEKIKSIKDKVRSEEATKQSMVLPLLHILGYDIFDPEEVIPEVPCDISGKGDKVDYVLCLNGKHEILIECKECHQNLNNHISQLRKYFVASDARFAILTNGIQYLFFSDHEKSNIMDEKPFYSLSLLNLSKEDLYFLTALSKDKFNSMHLLYQSQEMRYRTAIMENIKREFSNPSKAFVSVLTSNVYSGKLHESVYNKFAVFISDCIKSIVMDDLNKGNSEIKNDSEEQEKTSNYTEEEQKIINIILGWLKNFETEEYHICVTPLADGFIRFSYGNKWWPICNIKYRPYWEYKYSVKICNNAKVSETLNHEVKTLEEISKFQNEIENQCSDSKSRLFKYRVDKNM